jgi:hypothetical protein
MGLQLQFSVIDTTEPALWIAIVASSLAAVLLGAAVGRRAVAIGGMRALALAVLDLVVLLPVLLVLEVVLLSTLFAMRTGGATACLPLVRHVLLIPAAVGALAALLTWRRAVIGAEEGAA